MFRRLAMVFFATAALGSLLTAVPAGAVPSRPSTPVFASYFGDSGCIGGGVPVTLKKGRRVAFWNADSFFTGPESKRLQRRYVHAGETVCQLAWSLGPLKVSTSDGLVTGVTTPGFPTVADLQALKLSPSTPVAPGVWLPRPDVPAAVGSQPTAIRPVRSWVDPALEAHYGDAQRAMLTEWEVVGGRGLMFEIPWTSGADAFAGAYTAMNPDGSVRIIQNDPVCYSGTTEGHATFEGHAVVDYGQALLPISMLRNWPDANVPGPYPPRTVARFGPPWQGLPLLNGTS